MSLTISRNFIKQDINSSKDRPRNINKIRSLFDLGKKNEFTIDDQTWNDLTMDKVFLKLDRTCSTEGEAALYKILRNPIMNKEKLMQRGNLIKLFRKDIELVVSIRKILYSMRYDRKNRLIDMISEVLVVNKLKYYIYSFLGIVPILLVLAAIVLREPKVLIILMADILLQMYIHNREHDKISIIGTFYLTDLLKAGKKISSIVKNENLSSYTKEMKSLINELSNLNKLTYLLQIINSFGGFFEMLAIPFLIEEITYYGLGDQINRKKDGILELYYLVGEIDALISVAIYENNNKEKCITPKFTDTTSLKIIDGIHPLLEKPVANSINISKKGIVLTGTNMSGKSTFLRMVSTNILLAQTFNFALAKEYEACFLNIVSSISPKDDIESGKSYYLAEAEAILRIIKASQNDVPVFCPIDEIFRGTNPLERISSSAEILNYINKGKAICIVATHDRELSDMLKENYDFYHFSEDVDSKNGLKFDYKLKKGISKTRNAIKLLEYIGYPKEIVENSYKRIEKMERFL